jgi:hypothetical protein
MPAHALRISADGVLLAGDGPPELIEGVAYAALLAETAGELMGVEALASIEVTLSSGCCVIARHPDGELLAMTGARPTDIPELKRAMGLR